MKKPYGLTHHNWIGGRMINARLKPTTDTVSHESRSECFEVVHLSHECGDITAAGGVNRRFGCDSKPQARRAGTPKLCQPCGPSRSACATPGGLRHRQRLCRPVGTANCPNSMSVIEKPCATVLSLLGLHFGSLSWTLSLRPHSESGYNSFRKPRRGDIETNRPFAVAPPGLMRVLRPFSWGLRGNCMRNCNPKRERGLRPSLTRGVTIDTARTCVSSFNFLLRPRLFAAVPPGLLRALPIRALAILTLVIIVWAAVDSPVHAADDREGKPVDFAREILPILSNKCFVCHGPAGQEKEVLRLDSFAAATRDLDGHRAIDPAAPEKSELLIRINSEEDPMPPADAEKQLTARERELLSRWARQGGKYARHWAFVPPKKQPPSNKVAQTNSMIDAFVASRLKEVGISFSPVADRATLARRVALVLTGLPPEPKQLAAFLTDKKPGAYERLVDQLLDSPRFGEHQARYWLDAVRYGDTHGLHLDNRRGIYPYRDWVVRALNDNLPLDEFIKWQIAGDLMVNPTIEQRVATGYVRLNPSTGEGGAIPAEFQMKNNFDRVETLGTVFLGMSLTCSRCHSHKYDPIPQTEYYRLLAFFNSTAEPAMDGNKYEYGPTVKAPQNQDAWKNWAELMRERDRFLTVSQTYFEQSNEIALANAKKWLRANPAERMKLLADPKGPFAVLKRTKEAADISSRIATDEKSFTTSLVAQDLPQTRITKVLRRGEYNQPIGEPLVPGIVTVMAPFPERAPRNRLGLALWLTSRNHPLVARVLINRIWQRTFGEGLVRTPEDFGLQGEQPTHPRLLDWLAVELYDRRWDLKHILRLMVTSRTFRQSSAWLDDVDDPENRLLARGPRHRLDAEVLRDVALRASGLLDPHMGGEGVKPYQPAGMWLALAHPASNTKQYVRDKGKLLYRRSLYVYWKRTSPHPMMTLFDAPDRESSCVRRSRTNTSLQSLGLLNETQRIEMARMLAERLLREGKEDRERLNLLFTLLTCRNPTERERAACTKLLRLMRKRYANDGKQDALALLSTGEVPRNEKLNPTEHTAWTQVAVTVLASDVAILLY